MHTSTSPHAIQHPAFCHSRLRGHSLQNGNWSNTRSNSINANDERVRRGPARPTVLRIFACLLALAALVVDGVAQAPPQDPSQFDITGFIQAATLNNQSNVLSGGTITVNHQRIVVPDNTVLQMPATALTWQQVFAMNPLGVAGETGLAQADSKRMPGLYEAHVIGNRVGNTYIAGLMFLSQHSLQSSQGFINYIDYTTGYFEVGGVTGVQNTGQKVKINDPDGKFGRKWSPDPRFTIDENNPTVRSETGYPMCILAVRQPRVMVCAHRPTVLLEQRPADSP
jgi:hypothetical protein